MVDINLFQEGEEEKEWDPTPQKDSEASESSLDDFKFEDESKTPALDEKSILDEAFEPEAEPQEKPMEDGYDIGPDDQKKKTGVWTWVVLGVVVVSAVSYLYLFQPKKPEIPSNVVPVNLRPVVKRDTSIAARSDSTRSNLPAVVDSTRTLAKPAMGGNRTAVFAVLTKAVVENLGQQRQFGTILLNDDRFSVEYVSDTPGVSDAMGYRIKTLTGASEITASPEERHRTAGAVHYWGVVSGSIPKSVPGAATGQPRQYASVELFIGALKSLIQENGLADRGVTRSGEAGQTGVQAKVEGSRGAVLKFLESLKQSPGNYTIRKLVGVPVDIADFEATKIKLVLEFTVSG
jgi:hypothetical protein